jgi:hypothetical protein
MSRDEERYEEPEREHPTSARGDIAEILEATSGSEGHAIGKIPARIRVCDS